MIYIVAVVFVLLISLAVASWSSAPFVPTRKTDLSRILKLAQLKKGQTFYDLGCGNGRVVHYLAEKTEAMAIGVEMAIPIYVWAKIRQILSGLENFKIVYNSFFNINLKNADVVYIFGYPKSLKRRVAEKIKTDLKKDAKIISYAFKIEGLHELIKDQPTKNDMPIYVYKINS